MMQRSADDIEAIRRPTPWLWVPTLYFAQALPYVAVMVLSVVMYKQMGISNTDIALYTSWLYLPWVVKPLWSPWVDLLRTKRWWVVTMELAIAASLAAVALTVPASGFFRLTLGAFWIMAFLSATHDIASDGFYMLALDSHGQSVFVGIRTTFYRIASLVGQGAVVALAGVLEGATGSIPRSWAMVMGLLSAFFLLTGIYHYFVLPRPKADTPRRDTGWREMWSGFVSTFADFFRKPGALTAILFILLYRLPEAQLVKLINPFLLDPVEAGGLGLSVVEVGFIYGFVGIIGLMGGGIAGGLVASMQGLRFWLRPMAWSMSATCLVFVYLAAVQPQSFWQVGACVLIEQAGYGFGFTALTLYMLYFSQGRFATAHYSICTGFMALGMMLPGMAAGWLQETMGYIMFFWWVMACCAVTIAMASVVRVPAGFGLKHDRK